MDADSKLETYTMPEWSRTNRQLIQNAPTEKPTLRITFESKDKASVFVLRRYIKDDIDGRLIDSLPAALCVSMQRSSRS